MKVEDTKTREMRTWFGVTARVTVGPGFIHKTGTGGLLIPHPPLANWLLRKQLPGHLGRRLSFIHEFAHFQTAPLLAAYMLSLVAFVYLKTRPGVPEIFLLAACAMATWEIMSEGYTILENAEVYRISYEGVTRIPRILFWLVGVFLAASGWCVALYQ